MEKMRFKKDDVCMEDDVVLTGDRDEIVSGYLCAYGAFVKMTDYEKKLQEWLNDDEVDDDCSIDDCYINFYPHYNMETKEFSVQASYYIGKDYFEHNLDLTDKETDYLKKVFFKTYFDCSVENADKVLAEFYAE